MLTRLKVNGFKNLIETEVHFGPFTCIAGANGVGKSNLFDAIRFLSALADRPLIEAALSVRDEESKSADLRSIFHHVGDRYASEISLEAEMIIPSEGEDDLGQVAKAGITFLRYTLVIAHRFDQNRRSLDSLEILKEELDRITLGDAPKHLLFQPTVLWRNSAVKGRRFAKYISTESNQGLILLHQDTKGEEKGRGRPLPRLAANLPRTVLSTITTAEYPTALLARREMQSWQLLQLEPSSLRKPDTFSAPSRLSMDGSHLAATLYRIARDNTREAKNDEERLELETQIYGQVANRLSYLIDDVRRIDIDRDERRELLTLQVTGHDGTTYPARALSDGTLRFLALAVLDLDPEMQGVLCLEEPENGIHPGRIPAMLTLLKDIATNTKRPIGVDNPLRQVIVNTHSPAVVREIPDDTLLVAVAEQVVQAGRRFNRVSFRGMSDTWRTKGAGHSPPVARGQLLDYLRPIALLGANGAKKDTEQRVVDRPDLRLILELIAD